MPMTPILIVGAGPTGLVLAYSLARQGVPVRIVDAQHGPGQRSRAMGVHARTLEFYRAFGFAGEVVQAGIPAQTIHLRHGAKPGGIEDGATLNLGNMGKGLSPYPFLLCYPQDDHERLLIAKLETLGVAVEWGTSLQGFDQDEAAVHVVLDRHGAAERVEVAYLCGCDGTHSRVRETLGLQFSGGTYDQLFYVADVRIERGFDPDIYVNLGARTLAIMMPVRSSGMQRLIGLVPDSLHARRGLTFEDIRPTVEPLAGVQVAEVNWFSTYRVHHRVADHFRVGRVFIAGDAGHVHSPAGGQGMNTGIGDAVNLGWKLAHVVQGRAGPELLDTYESERIAFARTLVATTDRAFQPMVADSLKGRLVRDWLAPAVVGLAARFPAARHAAFRTVSQIRLHYPDSPLSEGAAGIAGGDRLPWVPEAGHDNFDLLRSLDWQVHVYGQPEAGLAAACARHGLDLHTLPWGTPARKAGLRQDAAYLVRPDGHVGLACATNCAAALDAYAERLRIGFAPQAAGLTRAGVA